jgi:hypothetical protein
VKDQFQGTLPVKLYEEMPVESHVIDTSGNKKVVKTYEFIPLSHVQGVWVRLTFL